MVSGSTGNSPQSPNFGLFWALVPDKMGETARIGGGDLRGGVKKNSKNRKFSLANPKSRIQGIFFKLTLTSKIMKTLIIPFIAGLLCVSPLMSTTVVLSDDFSGGTDDWAVREFTTQSSYEFSPGELQLVVGNTNTQPVTVYQNFTPVSLADGEILRLAVTVSSDNTTSRPGDLRIGLGFADPIFSGTSATSPEGAIKGYHVRAPSGGNTSDLSVRWVGDDDIQNFFNTSTTTIGSLVNSQTISDDETSWVFEITRSGDNLIFGSSLNGAEFSNTIAASGANVINDFEFNTVALAHGFASNATAYFYDVEVTVIPEPQSFAMLFGVIGLALVVIRRRFKH